MAQVDKANSFNLDDVFIKKLFCVSEIILVKEDSPYKIIFDNDSIRKLERKESTKLKVHALS